MSTCKFTFSCMGVEMQHVLSTCLSDGSITTRSSRSLVYKYRCEVYKISLLIMLMLTTLSPSVPNVRNTYSYTLYGLGAKEFKVCLISSPDKLACFFLSLFNFTAIIVALFIFSPQTHASHREKSSSMSAPTGANVCALSLHRLSESCVVRDGHTNAPTLLQRRTVCSSP